MRPRLAIGIFLFAAFVVRALASAPAGAEALLLVIADQHSAYERSAQLVAHVDRLRAENPQLPMALLIDGDSLELGNIVARRSAGAIDFALFAALAQRLPVVLNLGNHEPEFEGVEDTVTRLRAAGVTVISNLANRATGRPFAPASTLLKLGSREAVVVGVATDQLTTFRAAVRPSLAIEEPAAWARKNFPALLATAPIRIVLSHAGLVADRALLPLVPEGTLFAGAHDHLRFVHREGRTAYVHSGSWNEFLTLAFLGGDERGIRWEIRQQRIATDDPADAALAKLIRETQTKHLTAEDTAVVGRSPQALTAEEAARFVVAAVRTAGGVDAALIGRTTFGAGLPAGDVTRVALDACVRFEGTIHTAEVSGAQLQAILAGANETSDTPFAQRRGDYLVAEGPASVVPERRYRIATTDWVVRNAQKYLGAAEIGFTEQPSLKLKKIAAEALAASASPRK